MKQELLHFTFRQGVKKPAKKVRIPLHPFGPICVSITGLVYAAGYLYLLVRLWPLPTLSHLDTRFPIVPLESIYGSTAIGVLLGLSIVLVEGLFIQELLRDHGLLTGFLRTKILTVGIPDQLASRRESFNYRKLYVWEYLLVILAVGFCFLMDGSILICLVAAMLPSVLGYGKRKALWVMLFRVLSESSDAQYQSIVYEYKKTNRISLTIFGGIALFLVCILLFSLWSK